jgi:hypothetical protein
MYLCLVIHNFHTCFVAQIMLQTVYKKGRNQLGDTGMYGKNITVSQIKCILLGRFLPLLLKFYTIAHTGIERSS